MKPKVYISGPLTNFDRRSLYEELGKVAEGLGYEAYVPHKYAGSAPKISPEEIYQIDMKHLESSKLVIAYVGEPSLGVGAELERANANGIPIILMYPKSSTVSPFIRGVPMVKKEIAYINERYAMVQLRNVLSYSKEDLLKKSSN